MSRLDELDQRLLGDIINVRDDAYGAVGDDGTDDSAKIQASATAAAGSALYVPKGTFKVNTKISLPSAGLTIEGQGYDSVLKVGSNNQILLEMLSGGWLRLYNIRLVGDGTATSSSDGVGLKISDTSDIELDTVWFEDFGWAAWQNFSLLGTVRSRIRGRNITVTGGKNPAADENADIYMRGQFKDIQLENLFLEASATTPIGNGVFIVQTANGEEWESASVRGVTIRGHGKRGVVISSEVGASNFESGKVSVSDAKIYDTIQEGIKTKNVDRVFLDDIYIEGCDTIPEIAGNLQGSIFINRAEDFVGNNIQVHESGTDGIRFHGREEGTAAGVGRSKLTLTNFICNTCDESGIYIGHNTQSVILNAPQIYDSGNAAIRIKSTTALATPEDVIINSPRIRRSGADGISIEGLSGENVGRVIVNSPSIDASDGFGIVSSRADYFQVNGGLIFDNGQGASNTHGIRISNTTKAKISGVRSTNIAGSTQTHGLSMGSGNTDLEIHDCDLTGNATAPVSYAAPTTIRAANNNGWLEGSETFDPSSLADGAGETTTVTVTDAALGDYATASFSLDLQGITVTAWVSSANTVSVRFQNESGGVIDLGSGTLAVRVKK